MIGTTFPASIGTGTTRHQLPAVDIGNDGTDRAARPMIGTSFPASIGTTARRGPARPLARPWPWMIGTTFPAVDRHGRHDGDRIGTTFPASMIGNDGHHRGRCRPWPWMIGTTFPASIIGNRHGPRSQSMIGTSFPASIDTTGTTAAVASRGPG